MGAGNMNMNDHAQQPKHKQQQVTAPLVSTTLSCKPTRTGTNCLMAPLPSLTIKSNAVMNFNTTQSVKKVQPACCC